MHTLPSRSTCRHGLLLLLAVSLPAACGGPASSASPRLLTTIGSIRALRADAAGQGWPVRIQGVVTYVDPQWGRLFVEEHDGALAVDINGLGQSYSRGDLVDVAGWTAASDVPALPLVTRATIERRGTRPLAAPPLVTLSALNGTTCDGRSLQTTGMVKELSIWNGYLRLHVASGQHSVEVRVQEFPLLDMSALVGATIQSVGVCIQAPAAEARVADLRVMVRAFGDLGLTETLHAELDPGDRRAAGPDASGLDTPDVAGRGRPVLPGPGGRHRHVCRPRVVDVVSARRRHRHLRGAARRPGHAARGRPARGQRLDGSRQLRSRDRPAVVPGARTGDAAGGAAGALSAPDDRG